MSATSRHVAPFAALEVATALSGIANGVSMVAFPWLVLELTGSASAAAAIGAVTLLPLLLTSLVSGTLVDMVGKRRVSVASDLLSLVSVAAIPVLSAWIGLNFGLLAGLAVLGAAFDPAGITAREAMLPEAARAAGLQLERVNGTHEAVWGVAFLVGPGVGGVLIAVVGATNAFWVTAACFGMSALLMVLVRVPGAGRPAVHERVDGFWSATKEGLVFLWGDPVLRSVSLLTALLVGFWLPIEGVLLPVYFQQQQEPGHLGVVLMSLSAGGVLGSLAYAAAGTRVRRRPAFVGALLVTSSAVVGMAFLPPLLGLLAFGFAAGAAYGPINPIVNVAMQERTPVRLRGRILGLSTSVAYAAGPAGYLLVGPMIEQVGLRSAFLLLAGGLGVVALGSIWIGSLEGLDDAPREGPAQPDAQPR
jgi:MFS family permease